MLIGVTKIFQTGYIYIITLFVPHKHAVILCLLMIIDLDYQILIAKPL